MATVPADVGTPNRFSWHTALRWFGVLCLLGAAYFAGYVAWCAWVLAVAAVLLRVPGRQTTVRGG